MIVAGVNSDHLKILLKINLEDIMFTRVDITSVSRLSRCVLRCYIYIRIAGYSWLIPTSVGTLVRLTDVSLVQFPVSTQSIPLCLSSSPPLTLIAPL